MHRYSTMEVEIRRAISSDARSMNQIAMRTFPMACPSDSDRSELEGYVAEKMSERYFQEIIDDQNRIVLCAVCGGEFAGFSVVAIEAKLPIEWEVARSAELEKLYVDPSYHGTGVAHKLTEKSLNGVTNAGLSHIFLGVYSGNERAKRFYSKLGFEEVGQTEFRMGNEVHLDSVMVANIA